MVGCQSFGSVVDACEGDPCWGTCWGASDQCEELESICQVTIDGYLVIIFTIGHVKLVLIFSLTCLTI